jgi:hypothetical protein
MSLFAGGAVDPTTVWDPGVVPHHPVGMKTRRVARSASRPDPAIPAQLASSLIETAAADEQQQPSRSSWRVLLAPACNSPLVRLRAIAYLCRVSASTSVGRSRAAGGALARLSGRVWCVRAPGLISVRDLGLWVGDVMVDGVFPRDAVRPLGLGRPSTRRWRQRYAGSWPRGIGVK